MKPSIFSKEYQQTGINSLKWNDTEKFFGKKDMIPLWVGDMDFAVPQEVSAALAKRAAHPIYGYPGLPDAFFEVATQWIYRRYGIQVETTSLTHVPGIIPGMHLAIETVTEPGDEVIIQPPVYFPFFQVVKNRGRTLVENPLIRTENGDYLMDLQDLKEKITSRTKLIILCSPHNPVGRVWKRDELTALAEIAAKHDLYLISDEVHGDLVYQRQSFVPFYSLPRSLTTRSLTFFAPSKTFNLAGLFTSFVMIPNPQLRKRFKTTVKQMAMDHLNLFGIEATIAAYRYGDAWLDELLPYLQENARYLQRFIHEHCPEVEFILPEATYFAWLNFQAWNLTDQQLKQFFIEKAGLGLNDGMIFGQGGSGFQRLNFACPRPLLQRALECLLTAYRKHIHPRKS